MDRRRVFSALLLAAGFACLAASMSTSPVAACSGALVTFEKIRVAAQRIVIGTIIDANVRDGVAERITLRVEAVFRGVSGPEVVLEPPTYMGCDGRIGEPVGSRLLVATGPRFFSVGPAVEMHPYWRLLAGNVVEPAGVDDPDPDHLRLDGLLTDLGGLPLMSAQPADIAEPLGPAEGSGALVPIILATLLVAAALFTGAWRLARRRQ